MSKALDTVEQVVVVGVGVGLLIGGIKLYKSFQAALADGAKLPGAPAGVVPGSSSTYTTPTGEQCHTDVGWLSQKTQCDAPLEPPEVQKKDRSYRLKWALDNANEHTALAALNMAGKDIPLELDAFFWAGGDWKPPSGEENADYFHRDEDAGKILLWWGSNRAGDPDVLDQLVQSARLGPLTKAQAQSLLTDIKSSADRGDVAAVAAFAKGGT